MKIAVSSYSFRQAFADGRMGIMDVIPKAAEMGYQGVEIVRQDWSHEEALALAGQLKPQSEQYGVPIVAYMTGADFLKNGLDAEVKRLCGEADIARAMGAPRMRHDSTGGRDATGREYTVDEALPIVAEGYRRVTEYAQSIGVNTMIENHGYFFQDSDRVKRLIEAVHHENFGWNVDIGNFLCADESPTDAVKTAAPMVVHAHAKDFFFRPAGAYIPEGQGWFGTRGLNSLRGAIIGHGVVDVKACLALLKDAGYDGWLSIEFEGIEDCLTALKYDLTNIRELGA